MVLIVLMSQKTATKSILKSQSFEKSMLPITIVIDERGHLAQTSSFMWETLVRTVSMCSLTFCELTADKINRFAHIAYFTDWHWRILRILRCVALRCVALRILQQAPTNLLEYILGPFRKSKNVNFSRTRWKCWRGCDPSPALELSQLQFFMRTNSRKN